MRITWRSVEWLDDEYRSRVEARLLAFKQEGSGADRVEIASQPASAEAGCTEVRISGVIRKCQLTAVREHQAPERALEDALDAFSRNISYVLETRGREPIVMGPPAPASAGAAAISSDLVSGLGDRLRVPLHAIAHVVGVLEQLPGQVHTLPGRALEGLARAARAPFRRSEDDGLDFVRRSMAPAPARGRLVWQSALAACLGAAFGTGAWWVGIGGSSGSVSPAVAAAPLVEPVAFRAVAGEPDVAFSAVAVWPTPARVSLAASPSQ